MPYFMQVNSTISVNEHTKREVEIQVEMEMGVARRHGRRCYCC